MEEFVRCQIFLPNSDQVKAQFYHERLAKYARSISSGYIWDVDEMSLELGETPDIGYFLTGHIRLGESPEDEWFVVNILIKMTEAFPELIAKVHDQDGEFMLIEAADVLPDWLEPETCENRVFLCQGKLCIINQDDHIQSPRLRDAISYVRKDPFKSFAGLEIQTVILDRLARFSDLTLLQHKALVLAPRAVIQLALNYPQLVPKALNLFFDSKSRTISGQKLLTGDATNCLLTFSRNHFAKLSFFPINPPKIYPIKCGSTEEKTLHDLGLKLTIGLDLLLQKGIISDEILSGLPNVDPVVGESDSTDWMEVDVDSIKEHSMQMNEEEIDDLMKKWDEEFDNSDENILKDSVDQLKGFMEQMSLYEGVDVSDEDSAEESDEDGDFLEFEILETLKHDPDLLMRIVELNAHAGISNVELMQRIKDMPCSSGTGMKKKGLSDIDPGKLEDAKSRPYRKLPDEVERQNLEREDEDSESNEEEQDVAEHTPTIEELFKTAPKKEIVVDDLELSTSDCETMANYYDQMDAELEGKLKSDIIGSTDPELNLAKSIVDIAEAGSKHGPSHTILSSLTHRPK